MATWQEIGRENWQAARDLYDAKRYRSCVSRCYYAVFSLLTYELARKGATFRPGRQTPAHAEVRELIEDHLTQFTEIRRANIATLTLRLYRLRLDADYTDKRVDRTLAGKTQADAAKVFGYFGVQP